MTPKAKEFSDLKVHHLVVHGEWWTSKKQTIYTQADFDDATYLRYRMMNGAVRTLHKDDIKTLNASGVLPRWAN